MSAKIIQFDPTKHTLEEALDAIRHFTNIDAAKQVLQDANVHCKGCTTDSCDTCDSTVINPDMVNRNAPIMPERKKELMGERIFNTAKNIINGHRQDDYGTPEDSFQNIANYWNAYLTQIADKREEGLTAKDIALMMVLFKIARLGHDYTKDSVVDICGYAAIYAAMHGD